MTKPILATLILLAACAPEPAPPPGNVTASADTAEPAPLPAAPPSPTEAAPVLSEVRTFRDWSVACDNGGGCEAASLAPGEGNLQDIGLVVRRPAGPGGRVSGTVRSGSDQTGTYQAVVDGRPIGITAIAVRGWEPALIADADAERLVAALVNARRFALRGEGAEAAISTAGASAAFRYMDERQGRAGTVTALVARGDRPANAVPPAPPLPTVVAAPLDRSAATALSPELVARLRRENGCVIAEVGGPDEAPVHPLGDGKALLLLSCGSGAYNAGSAPFVIENGTATKATFDVGFEWGKPGSDTRIVNGAWDARTGRLSSSAKGRGLGDCGVAREWAWDGTRFRLVTATEMGECRGAVQWLTVWRARVERR